MFFRKLKEADFPIVYDWLSNLENMKYWSSEPKTEKEAHGYLDWAIQCAERDESLILDMPLCERRQMNGLVPAN